MEQKCDPVIDCAKKQSANSFSLATIKLFKVFLKFLDLFNRVIKKAESIEEQRHRNLYISVVVLEASDVRVSLEQIPEVVTLKWIHVLSQSLFVRRTYVERISALEKQVNRLFVIDPEPRSWLPNVAYLDMI